MGAPVGVFLAAGFSGSDNFGAAGWELGCTGGTAERDALLAKIKDAKRIELKAE